MTGARWLLVLALAAALATAALVLAWLAAAIDSLDEGIVALDELYYVGDGGGVIEDDLAVKVEQMMRWLVEQYLRRGTHTANDPAVSE